MPSTRFRRSFQARPKLVCLLTMRDLSRWPAPRVFSLLILPLGIIVGFKFTPLPFLLAQSGVPVDQITSISSIVEAEGYYLF